MVNMIYRGTLSGPNVIPLQSFDVVNAGGTDVTEDSLLGQTLARMSQSERGEAYAIKRSSDFVNEYPRTDEDGI